MVVRVAPSHAMRPVLDADTGEPGADMVQGRLARAVDEVARTPGAQRVMLEGVQLPGGANPVAVPHKLGRKPVGVSIAGLFANVTVWEPSKAARDASFIYLRSSASCVIDLEVW